MKDLQKRRDRNKIYVMTKGERERYDRNEKVFVKEKSRTI